MRETELLKSLIREVPDFPKPGIGFKDFTPLLRDPRGLALAVELMVNPASSSVGTPGSSGWRRRYSTASGCTRSALTMGVTAPSMMKSTSPATRALTAAAEPRNGTCST